MLAFVVHKSLQLAITLSLAWKGFENFTQFKILVATHSNFSSKSGQSISRTDLVAYGTELLVMS